MHRRLPQDLLIFSLGLGLGTYLLACGSAGADPRTSEATADAKLKAMPVAKEAPMPEIRFQPVQVIGYPLELTAPVPPLATLASDPLVPGYIYQLSWEGAKAADWNISIEGGVGSDIIMESFPPQLGQAKSEFTIKSPSFAFRIDEGVKHPIKLNIEATLADGRAYYKQFFGRSIDADPSAFESVPGEILIGLQPGTLATSPALLEWLIGLDFAIEGTLNGDTVIHARSTAGIDDFFALHALVIGDPRVQYAEPNYVLHAMDPIVGDGTQGSLGIQTDTPQ